MAGQDWGDPSALNRQQPVPLYHQIYLQLREEITSGERPFGSRLPTEHEISVQFGVSRITARRALDELADDGFVERRRRVGTTVVFRSPATPIQGNIEQALESLLTFGRKTTARLLESEWVAARAPIDSALGVEAGTEILKIVRVRSLDGKPVGHFTTFVPADLGAVMTQEKISTAPMLTLIEQAGVKIGAAHQTISAALADPVLSLALEVDIGSPILRVTRTVLDITGRPVQHILAQFRPDKYQIQINLGRVSDDLATGRRDPQFAPAL